jgi:hypothetical protein
LAEALSMAEQPLAEFSQPFDYWADALEFEDVTGGLAVLRMAVALKVAGRHPDAGALLERLENSEGAPWPQLRAAVERSPATQS